MKPYTYLIGWSALNLYYYGVRFSKNCSPDDLFKTYFTSSETVKTIISKHGRPDIIQIRKTFKDVSSARLWEHKVLRRIKATKDSKWLNKTDNISIQHDEITIAKMTNKQKKTMLARYGVEYSSQRPEFVDLVKQTKLKKYGASNYNNTEKQKQTCLAKYGVEYYSQTEEAKRKKREKALKRYGSTCTMNSKEIKEKIKQNNLLKYGVEYYNQTEEAKQRRKSVMLAKYGVDNIFKSKEFKAQNALRTKKFWANAPKIVCPYCKKVLTNRGNYNRYHGEACKHKLLTV